MFLVVKTFFMDNFIENTYKFYNFVRNDYSYTTRIS